MGAQRGRPRSFEPRVVLARAQDVFWSAGFAATSLDDLSAATGLNRPSLYGAFGDKRALYLAALEQYRAAAEATMEEVLAPDRPLLDGLRALYARALSLYLGSDPARGCFLIGTAAAEAVEDEAIRTALGDSLRDLDAVLTARFSLAGDRCELEPDADPDGLAQMAAAILHTLAIRSRAGASRQALERTAEAGLALIGAFCAGKPAA